MEAVDDRRHHEQRLLPNARQASSNLASARTDSDRDMPWTHAGESTGAPPAAKALNTAAKYSVNTPLQNCGTHSPSTASGQAADELQTYLLAAA